MSLSTVDQAFLQRMVALKTMTIPDAIKHYNKCIQAYATLKSARPKVIRDAAELEDRMQRINR